MVGGPNRWNAFGGGTRRIAHLGAAFSSGRGDSSNETGPRLARESDANSRPNSDSGTPLFLLQTAAEYERNITL